MFFQNRSFSDVIMTPVLGPSLAAWMNFPSPMKIPTWEMLPVLVVLKNTRSPGSRFSFSMTVILLKIARDVRGSGTPMESRDMVQTKPEQSKEFGPMPPER